MQHLARSENACAFRGDLRAAFGGIHLKKSLCGRSEGGVIVVGKQDAAHKNALILVHLAPHYVLQFVPLLKTSVSRQPLDVVGQLVMEGAFESALKLHRGNIPVKGGE